MSADLPISDFASRVEQFMLDAAGASLSSEERQTLVQATLEQARAALESGTAVPADLETWLTDLAQEQLFAHLVQRQAPYVEEVIVAQVGGYLTDQEVNSLIQGTLEQAHANIQQFNPAGDAAQAWLARLAREQTVGYLLQQRNPAALLLLDTYLPGLQRSLSQSKFNDFLQPEDRDDITRNTLLRALHQGDRYDPQVAKVATWLNVLLHYETLDFLRVTKHISPTTLDAVAHAEADTVEQHLPTAESQPSRAMEELLQRLPAKRAQVIRLFFYGGLSYEAIAQQLGVKEVSVRSTVSRGVKQLQEEVNSDERLRQALRKISSWAALFLMLTALTALTVSAMRSVVQPSVALAPTSSGVTATVSPEAAVVAQSTQLSPAVDRVRLLQMEAEATAVREPTAMPPRATPEMVQTPSAIFAAAGDPEAGTPAWEELAGSLPTPLPPSPTAGAGAAVDNRVVPTPGATHTPTTSATATMTPVLAGSTVADATALPSPMPAATATATAIVPSATAGVTASPTVPIPTTETASVTATPTATASAAATATPTATPTASATALPSATPTVNASPEPSASATATMTPTATASATASATAAPTATPTATATASATASVTATATATVPSATASATAAPTETPTATASATAAPTETPTATASATAAPTETPTATATATATPTATPTATATATATPTETLTATATATATPTATLTATASATATATSTVTPTVTASATSTPTDSTKPVTGLVTEWSYQDQPERVEIIGVGMSNQAQQLLELPSARWLTVQLGGKLSDEQSEPPDAVAMTFDHAADQDDQTDQITLTQPYTITRRGYNFIAAGQAGDLLVEVAEHADASTARALLGYAAVPTEQQFSGVGRLVFMPVYHDTVAVTLTLPAPLTAPTDLTVQGAFIDNNDDDRVLQFGANAGEVTDEVSRAGPTAGDLLNLETITLRAVPAGTAAVRVWLTSPRQGGESAILMGVSVSYRPGEVASAAVPPGTLTTQPAHTVPAIASPVVLVKANDYQIQVCRPGEGENLPLAAVPNSSRKPGRMITSAYAWAPGNAKMRLADNDVAVPHHRILPQFPPIAFTMATDLSPPAHAASTAGRVQLRSGLAVVRCMSPQYPQRT